MSHSRIRPAEHCETYRERLPCGIPTSAECFEASLPHLPRSSRAPNTSGPSRSLISSTSLVCTIVFWTLRFCVPLLLSFPPHSHSVDPSSNLVEHLLEHLHPLLLGHTGLLWHSSVLSACSCHGSWGPNPGCFFTIWHVLHPPHPTISMLTSPSESRLPIHPRNQLNSGVTSFRNIQATEATSLISHTATTVFNP